MTKKRLTTKNTKSTKATQQKQIDAPGFLVSLVAWWFA